MALPLVDLVPELPGVAEQDGSVNVLDAGLVQPGPVQGRASVGQDDGVVLVARVLGRLLGVGAVLQGQGVVLEGLAVAVLTEEVVALLFELASLL